MRTATTIADASGLKAEDAFDLEAAYFKAVKSIQRDADRQGEFHPSAAAMCGKMNVYEFIRAPQILTIDPHMEEIFAMGHLIHDHVQSRLEAMVPALAARGITMEFEREVKRTADDELFSLFGIGGTTDGILRFYEEGEIGLLWEQRAVLEVKSINTTDFNKLTGPKRAHEWQAHLYAYRFDTPLIYYWYFNKNNSKRAVYVKPFERAIFDEALARYAVWLEHAENGTLPERDESWLDCKSCAYRKLCNPSILTSKSKRSAQKMSSNRKKRLLRVRR